MFYLAAQKYTALLKIELSQENNKCLFTSQITPTAVPPASLMLYPLEIRQALTLSLQRHDMAQFLFAAF